MEKRLFNLYLKYIKEFCPTVWERLGKIPSKLKRRLWCMVIFYVASIVTLTIAKYLNEIWSLLIAGASIIFVILCIVFGVLLFVGTEKYEIDISDESMKDYWDYCFGVRKWFQKEFLFSNRKDINVDNDLQEVKKRLDNYLETQNIAIDKKNERIDKWIQALAIPFVLAVITSVLEKNEKTVEAMSEIFSILLILAIIIGVVWVINSIVKLLKKQKLEQMKYFSEDLQGAIDCYKYSVDLTEKTDESKVEK